MTEEQMYYMVAIAFVGGIISGFWVRRSFSLAATILTVLTFLNVASWITYGFIVNWQSDWGIKNVVGGILYSGLGFLVFSVPPGVVGAAISSSIISAVTKSPSQDD